MTTHDRICELSGKCKVWMIISVSNFHFSNENLSKSHGIEFMNVIEYYVKYLRLGWLTLAGRPEQNHEMNRYFVSQTLRYRLGSLKMLRIDDN